MDNPAEAIFNFLNWQNYLNLSVRQQKDNSVRSKNPFAILIKSLLTI